MATYKRIRHRGQRDLTAARHGASRKAVKAEMLWERGSDSVDISPLCACTLAVWAAVQTPAPTPLAFIGIAWGRGDGSKPETIIIEAAS